MIPLLYQKHLKKNSTWTRLDPKVVSKSVNNHMCFRSGVSQLQHPVPGCLEGGTRPKWTPKFAENGPPIMKTTVTKLKNSDEISNANDGLCSKTRLKNVENPAGLPAGILQLTGRLREKYGALPCRISNSHGGGSGPQAL